VKYIELNQMSDAYLPTTVVGNIFFPPP
jgi:hypothetical protein